MFFHIISFIMVLIMILYSKKEAGIPAYKCIYFFRKEVSFMNFRKTAILLLSTVLTLTAGTSVYATTSTDSDSVTDRAAAREKARKDSGVSKSDTDTSSTITNASEVQNLSEEERIPIIGKLCQADYANSGILASVSAAQCILESGYMSTDLAVNANNCFGMKVTLSSNDWSGSTWDGTSKYTKETWEEYGGQSVTVTADFRKYDSVADSVADHSAYLLNAKDDNGLRYEGLKGETDYKKAIQIIKNGGYATDSNYVSKICNIIEKYNLTQYDSGVTVSTVSNDEAVSQLKLYRIRKSWDDKSSQLGAYLDQETAEKNCKKGYSVFDPDGNKVYTKK